MRKCPVMALSAMICKDYMHKKIMNKAAKALEKDASHYKKEEKIDKKMGSKKALAHHKVEEKEAKSAAKDLKKRAKKAHE